MQDSKAVEEIAKIQKDKERSLKNRKKILAFGQVVRTFQMD